MDFFDDFVSDLGREVSFCLRIPSDPNGWLRRVHVVTPEGPEPVIPAPNILFIELSDSRLYQEWGVSSNK